MMRAIGIEPYMQFQSALMRFFRPESKRIVKRIGGLSLHAREVIRPGLERTLIQRIRLRPHLKNNGIEMMVFQKIEQAYGLFLLLGGGKSRFAGPVDIGNSGYPGRTEFSRRPRSARRQILNGLLWSGTGEKQ